MLLAFSLLSELIYVSLNCFYFQQHVRATRALRALARWPFASSVGMLVQQVSTTIEMRALSATGTWDLSGEERNDRFLPNATEIVSWLIRTCDDFVSGFYIFSSLSEINLLPHQQFS